MNNEIKEWNIFDEQPFCEHCQTMKDEGMAHLKCFGNKTYGLCIENQKCDYRKRIVLEQQLLAEQAKTKELENALEQQKQYCRDFKLFQIKNVDDLQSKNKKLVEIINSIVKYCAKTDTIEWFDYDNIKAIADEVNNAK